MVQALLSSQDVGQSPSQDSPSSTIPLPHELEQSGSDPESQPSEQQPSSVAEQATGPASHRAVQVEASPTSEVVKHIGVSSQLVGQAPSPESMRGSHDSPGSRSPFPHLAGSTMLFVTLLVTLFVVLFDVLFDVLFEIFARFLVSLPQATTSEKDNKARSDATSFVCDAMRYLKVTIAGQAYHYRPRESRVWGNLSGFLRSTRLTESQPNR